MPTTNKERLILTEFANKLDQSSRENVHLELSYQLLNQLRESARKSGIEGSMADRAFHEIEAILHKRMGELAHKYNDAYRLTSEQEIKEILDPGDLIYEINEQGKK